MGTIHGFDGHLRVNPVLVEEVDSVDPQPFERGLGDALDLFGPAVHANHRICSPAEIELEPELGGDHHLPAEWSEGFAHQLFVRVRAIHFSGIGEGDAAFDGGSDQSDHLLPVANWFVSPAHSHAAQPDSRDFQVSKFALLDLLDSSL
jgi:hypothetical protein